MGHGGADRLSFELQGHHAGLRLLVIASIFAALAGGFLVSAWEGPPPPATEEKPADLGGLPIASR